jgi:hypothetical protein
MRLFAGVLLSMSIVASPLLAHDAKDAGKEKSPATAAADKPKGTARPENAVIESELRDLRGLIEEQRQELEAQRAELKTQQLKMEALEGRLHVAETSELVNAPAEASAAVVAAATPQTPDGVAKQIEDRVRQIGPFSFSGDIRLRDEPFIGGPSNESLVRNRERYRVRLNINAKLNADFSGGLTLATGDFNQPITANQDANQDFTRKPFYLDKAFVLYTPHQIKPLSIVAGKFSYPWYRTELTWDNDLNPEGVAETLNFKMDSTPVFKRFAVVGFQLPFSETFGVNNNVVDAANQSIHQSVVYGGQIQTEWQISNWLRLTADTAFYNYHIGDPVAMALQTAFSASPGIGLLKLNPGVVQNSITVWKDASGVVKNAQFGSKFGVLDAIARFDVKTASAKWPIILLGDYVQNTKACDNAVNFFAPAGTTATTTASCNSRERRGYWLESRFGRLIEKGDLQFAYTRMFIEREAVLGVFNFDDMRQDSNVTEHRFELFYNVYRNITLQYAGLFGRPLNWGNSGAPENTLKRMQFDVMYRF